jgi:hypothetical protein
VNRMSRTRVGLGLLFLLSLACEEDALAPVSGFQPEECQDLTNCSEGNYRLDSGVRSDSGPGDPLEDSGIPTGDLDGGADNDGGVADSGAPDTGAPDSGVPPPPSVFLDLRSPAQYNTRYVFDVSGYLFGISGIADGLDFIDQALSGNIDTGFPPLDALIQAVISQYVPMWVVDLVDALNTVANLMDEFEAVGTMFITQDPPLAPTDPTTAIHGTEAWSVFYVRLIDRCPGGRNDPNWPQCARVPIPITNSPTPIGTPSGNVDVQVYIQPFNGTLNAGVPAADFIWSNRSVELEMQKLVLLVLNIVTNVATPYPTLRDALRAAVDCPGLGQRAYDFARNSLGLNNLLALAAQASVEDACDDTIDGVINGIANVAVGIEAFEFDQRGLARDLNPNNGVNTAELLEDLNAPSGADRIDGRFRFLLSTDLGGNWDGRR